MRLATVALLLICAPIICIAQQQVNPHCPAISVGGPTDLIPAGGVIRFTATIGDGGLRGLRYNWTVSSGKIVTNGELVIDVVDWSVRETVTATLDVEGLPAECVATASVTTQTNCGATPPILMDEFEAPFSKIEQERYNNILLALNNDPTARLHVIIYAKAPLIQAPSKLAALHSSILKRFPASERERITFTQAEVSGPNAAKFFIVPAGAENPIP